MRIVLDTGDGQITTIEREGEALSIHSLFAGLIEPALRGAGFTAATVGTTLDYDRVRGCSELFEEV